MRSDKIVINAGANIGANSAENDDAFLFETYVENPVAAHFAAGRATKNFILGRTGSGKTAIIRIVERASERPVYVNVYDMAMMYIANSNVFEFLNSLNAPLPLFFHYLWKHVLLTTYIQSFFHVKDESDSRNLVDRVTDHFRRDKRRERALQYLASWKDKFWITIDETVREVSEQLEEKISADLGGEIEKFSARAGYVSTLSKDRKSQLDRRLRQIMSPQQLAEISEVIGLLSDFVASQKYQKTATILIDQIDENWVDEGIRFKLIRGLIEAVRTFRSIESCKIYCALRIDVYDRVVQETADSGFQSDKYEDYFARIKWDEKKLYEIADARIALMFRRQYTGKSVHFEDIFYHNVGTIAPFTYIVRRTLLRPRDIIGFVNICLDIAVDARQVTAQNIRDAEGIFSAKQRVALVAEWKAALPSLDSALNLISRRRHVLDATELLEGRPWEDFLMAVSALQNANLDPIFSAISSMTAKGSGTTEVDVLRVTLSELYRTGAVGIKTPSFERYLWSHADAPTLNPAVLDRDARLQVHAMLHRALLTDAREAGR